jgi:hypothetical protein
MSSICVGASGPGAAAAAATAAPPHLTGVGARACAAAAAAAACLTWLQLISQLDAELGIEKFRTELESTQVLVRGECGAALWRMRRRMHACVRACDARMGVPDACDTTLATFMPAESNTRPPPVPAAARAV